MVRKVLLEAQAEPGCRDRLLQLEDCMVVTALSTGDGPPRILPGITIDCSLDTKFRLLIARAGPSETGHMGSSERCHELTLRRLLERLLPDRSALGIEDRHPETVETRLQTVVGTVPYHDAREVMLGPEIDLPPRGDVKISGVGGGAGMEIAVGIAVNAVLCLATVAGRALGRSAGARQVVFPPAASKTWTSATWRKRSLPGISRRT